MSILLSKLVFVAFRHNIPSFKKKSPSSTPGFGNKLVKDLSYLCSETKASLLQENIDPKS